MNNFNEAIGVDVSKRTIDVHLYQVKKHQEFTNNKKGFTAMLKWAKKNTGLTLE